MALVNGHHDSLLIQDVRIFTGQGFIERGYVFSVDGKIAEVGAGNPPASLHSNTIVSKPGDTLLPGLIDAHIHADDGNESSVEQSLKCGVTTVCDMHNEADCNAKLKKLSNDPENKDRYADFKYCGYGATPKGGWPAPVILAHYTDEKTKAGVASWPNVDSLGPDVFVKQQLAAGASYIKIMNDSGAVRGRDLPKLPVKTLRSISDAANAHDVPAVAHALTFEDTVEALESGVDGLTHCFLDKAESMDKLLTLYLRNKAHCNPTLCTLGSLTTEGAAFQAQVAADPIAQRMLMSTASHENLYNCFASAKRPGNTVQNAYDTVKTLYRAGIPIIAGSDAARPAKGSAYGLSLHMEIHLLVHEIGMSPVDALRSATTLTAERFGFKDRGQLEAGKLADLVLVEGDIRNVLADKKNLCLPVKGVWREGITAKEWSSILA